MLPCPSLFLEFAQIHGIESVTLYSYHIFCYHFHHLPSIFPLLSWWRICLQCRRPGFNPWVEKIPWRRKRLPAPVFCLENSLDYIVHGVAKSQTQLSDFHTHTFPASGSFSNEPSLCTMWPKYWSFSFNISPYNEYFGLISFRSDWFDLLAVQGILKSFSSTTIQKY